jgi:hypothetical protein
MVVQLTSRTLRIHIPLGRHVTFEWRRPVCVTWQKAATQESATVPVIDVTRLIQLAVWSATFLGILLGCVIMRRKRSTPCGETIRSKQ